MNVVEKESREDEAAESLITDGGAGPKMVTKNGFTATPSKINRLVPQRDLRMFSPQETRRIIGERSRELQAFVAPLEVEIRRAHKYRSRDRRGTVSAQAKVATLVLGIIRDIAHRETGIFHLEPNVPQLVSVLCAGSVEVGIISGLVRRAQKAIALRDQLERDGVLSARDDTRAPRGSSYDVGRELDELTMLLKWYARRKMSAASLELDCASRTSILGDEDLFARDEHDVLFGFEVMHDHQVFGTKGCLLSCGLRLIGWDGQPLWLRVGVRWNGANVSARREWSSWTDPGNGAPIEVMPQTSPFCSLVPIRPNSQRLIIDEIRAFVPYAALDLPVGRCDVEFVISVLDNDGREILSTSRAESVCVPRHDQSSFVVPAPHAVGMWPHDVVSGDKLSELSISSGFKTVAGWERHTISVQFDVSLFMHAGESVMLECRFVDSKGDIVELSSLGIPFVASELNVAVESVSSYRYRRVLHPKGAWAFYRGLCVDIPVEFLLLTEGEHELTCEIVIVSSDDRVLCGDMGRVSVRVPSRASRNETNDFNHVMTTLEVASRRDARSNVELESVEVDPSWHFGGEECVRVQATFCPHNARTRIAELAAGRVGELFAPYRVEISLEREDGHALLQAFSDAMGMSFKPVTRAVCIEGHSAFQEHCVVANFRKEEVLGWSVGDDAGIRAQSKVRLFARVSALTPNGELIVTESKEFFVKPVSSGGRQVVEIKPVAPAIVDTVARAFAQVGKLTVRALVNMPLGDLIDDGVTVQAVVVKPDGSRDVLGKRALGTRQDAVWTRQQIGLAQFAVELERVVPPDVVLSGHSVEVSLISATGETLHTVAQMVQTTGVLVEAEPLPATAELVEGEVESMPHEKDFEAVEALAFGGSKKKGLLSRLFSGKRDNPTNE